MRFLVGFVPVLGMLAQTPTALAPRLRASAVTRTVKAKYTPEARAAGLQGTVSLYVEVDGDGRPAQVWVMEGLGLGLDEEAAKAVEQWEFRPGPGASNDVQDVLEIDVPFRLDPSAPWSVESEWYRFPNANRERYGEIVRPVPIRYAAPDPAACSEPGTVEVALAVGTDGLPRGVKAEGGALAEAAVKAVESWQFSPATGNGKTVEAQTRIEFACRPVGGAEKAAIDTPQYRVGGGVSPPVLLTKFEPEYSELARKAKLQGTNSLAIQISPEGKTTHFHVVQRLGMGLDQKAIEAVKHWRFKPGMKGDNPVAVEATIQVNFRLL
jgi:TonB family protein